MSATTTTTTTTTTESDLRWDLPLVGSSPKTVKGVPDGDYVGITYITPSLARCPWSTKGCRKGCLSTAGRGAMTTIQRARHRRGLKYDSDPSRFAAKIAAEARALAGNIKGTLYLRVNGTSDALALASAVACALVQLPGAPSARVVMYDYTKCHPSLWPRDGVHRTWSRSEDTPDDEVIEALARQISVAVVVEGATHKERAELAQRRFGHFPVVDGTLSDVRPLDVPGSLVVLKPLGRAKRDTTGFVIR